MGKKIFFPNLDGLRFIAFFAVFWQHAFGGFFVILKEYNLLGEQHYSYFVTGGYGVSFFFVLSGFLITYLLLQEDKENGKIDIKAFYIRRVLRIFPLYYLVLFWGFCVYPILRYFLKLNDYDNGNFLYYVFFLSNFDTIKSISEGLGRSEFIGITWSVAIEEQFYIFWAILFFFLSSRYYKYIFPLLIIGSTFFRFSYQNDSAVSYFHTFSVVSDLAVGGGTAYLIFNSLKIVDFFSELKKAWILLIYILGLILIFIYPSLFWLNQAYWLQRLIFSLFFAFVIVEQNYAQHSFYKMKNFKNLSRLGIYTYGLYLLHPIALFFTEKLLHILPFEKNSFMWIVFYGSVGFCLSLIISYISYHYFETFFLKLKRYYNG